MLSNNYRLRRKKKSKKDNNKKTKQKKKADMCPDTQVGRFSNPLVTDMTS